MVDFFVSYTQVDRAWAEWIAWQLEHAGYTVSVQAWDFRPSMNFAVEMDKAARNCRRTLAVLSPSYLKSEFCSPEWATAFAADPKGERGWLVPVRVAACDLSGLLGQVIYIDLVGKAEAAACEELLRGVKFERARPTTPPRFPDRLRAAHFPGKVQNARKAAPPRKAPKDKKPKEKPSTTILLVDEDRIQMRPFIAEVELRGHTVRLVEEADDGLNAAKQLKRLDLAIIDIMLPSVNRYSSEETQNHLYTGVFLARDIRRAHPDVPLLLISNHRFPESLRKIDRAMTSIGNCAFLSKQSFFDPGEFADVIDRVLAHGISKASAKSIFGRLWRSIILQPKMGGVGIDLKELFRP